MSQVLCVGVATVDNIVLIEKYPSANQRVVALDSMRSIGGPATIAAVTLARLGIEVSLAASLEMMKREDLSLKLLRMRALILEM